MAFKQKTTSTTVHALEVVKHCFEPRIFPHFQFVHVKMSDLIKGKTQRAREHFDNTIKNSLGKKSLDYKDIAKTTRKF